MGDFLLEIQLLTQEFEQFGPKLTSELGITITEYVFRQPEVLDYMVEK